MRNLNDLRMTIIALAPALFAGAPRAMAHACSPSFPVAYQGNFVVERSDGAPCSAVFRDTSYTVRLDHDGGSRVSISFHSDIANAFLKNVILRGWMNEHCDIDASKMILTGDGTSLFVHWNGPATPTELTAKMTAQVERNGNMLCTAIANYSARPVE